MPYTNSSVYCFIAIGVLSFAGGANAGDDAPVHPPCARDRPAAPERAPPEPPRERLPVHVEMHDGTNAYYPRIADITDLEKIEGIWLDSGDVSDADLSCLNRARHLKILALPGFDHGTFCNITDAGLRTIAGMPELIYLRISTNRITDWGAAQLKRLRGVYRLELRSEAITDAGVAQLAELPDLAYLRLRVPLMTDGGLIKLISLDGLLYLDVCDTSVTGLGFASVGKFDGMFGNLVSLSGSFTDEGLEAIGQAELLWLSQLRIVGRGASDQGIEHLRHVPHLRRLTLQGTAVTKDAVRKLRQNCRFLKEVTVKENDGN